MKCLIVNRGEIALRAIQVCRELEIVSIWMTTEEEKFLEPGMRADEVIIKNHGTTTNIYNDLSVIESALIESGATHLYPGYGFLSENPHLAELCERLSIIFIGPKSDVLKLCSNKSSIQEKILKYGVQTLRVELNNINPQTDYILVKASQGGGGRGHKIVEPKADYLNISHIHQVIEETKSYATRLFQSDEVHTELFLSHCRHVEAQFIRSKECDAVLLGTRDCSIQRNFQKVIEEGEAPSEIHSEILSTFECFKVFLNHIDYLGVGTIEFLWDIGQKKLYFIELNCRIQVEHPVTEMLIGHNLVRDQFKVFLLGPEISRVHSRGHAIECRIYGEDPMMDFLPQPTLIKFLSYENFPFVRWDWCLSQGDSISSMYDPMIGKLIVWGKNRTESIQRAIQALSSLVIHGPITNQEFLISILKSERFASNSHDTAWLGQHILSWKNSTNRNSEMQISIQINTNEQAPFKQIQNWKWLHRNGPK